MPTIDFTSGYRDATQGSTLKALAQRRAEMAANMAARKTPQINDPWQGAAEVANTVSNSIREGRIAGQETAGRKRFAELLAGGLAPDEVGEAMGLDPETTMSYVKNDWDVKAAAERVRAEQEQQKTLFGHEDTTQAAQFAHQDTTAKTLAGAQEAAAVSADTRSAAEKRIEEKAAADKAVTDAAMSGDLGELEARRTKGLITPEDYATQKDAILNKLKPEQWTTATPEQVAAAGYAPGTPMQVSTKSGELKPGTVPVGQAKDDEAASKLVSDWDTVGGPNTVKSIEQMNKAMQLMSDKGGGLFDTTGVAARIADKTLPDWMTKWANPDAYVARDAVRDTIQKTLRDTLGAQFTENEGQALMDRAFDLTQTPAENLRRAKLVMEQITQIAANKQELADHWHKNRTTYGYTPKPIDVQKLRDMSTEWDPANQGGAGAGTETGGGGAATAPAPSDPMGIRKSKR